MATYSFKNVGKTKSQQAEEILTTTTFPFGIKTPLSFGEEGEGIFSMNYSIGEQFADNLRNLILTNWGERLGLYDFGANLRPLTTEFSSQDSFDAEAISRIRVAVQKWMPFVNLETFESDFDQFENKNTAVIKINIIYSIPGIDDIKRSLQVVLYAI